jgi:hypothetical protein
MKFHSGLVVQRQNKGVALSTVVFAQCSFRRLFFTTVFYFNGKSLTNVL